MQDAAHREAPIDALTQTVFAADRIEDLPFPGILTWDGPELSR